MSQAAAEFAKRWNGEGYEKGQGQLFFLQKLLIMNVYNLQC